MQPKEVSNKAFSERVTELSVTFAILFLVIGGGAALYFLGVNDLVSVLLEPPFKSAALGISQIIGSGLAIMFVFSRYRKKLRLKLSTFILFGAFIGLFSTIFSLFVSEILCGNIIYLMEHYSIMLLLMPIGMTAVSIFKLSSGFIAIISGAVSGAFLYYLMKQASSENVSEGKA